MNRPSNWYQMDGSERRAWQKQEREREDLEYERDRERENAGRAQQDAADQRRARRQAEESHAEEMENINDLLRDVQEELNLCRQWIKENGHWEAFDDWASYRRTD